MDVSELVLFLTLCLLLVCPLVSKRIERSIEAFFLAVGIAVSLATGKLISGGHPNLDLIGNALLAPVVMHESIPIGIFQAVLALGLVFHYLGHKVYEGIDRLGKRVGIAALALMLTLALGLSSSVVTVIISSLIASQVMLALPASRTNKVVATIAMCYAIGIGGALTPIGEPLATIATQKLSGPPYHAGPLFLFNLLAVYVIPLVVVYSLISYLCLRRARAYVLSDESSARTYHAESLRNVIVRAVKVYAFVVALVLIGESYDVLVDRYFRHMSPDLLYAAGIISAVVDNATLTAAMIGPELNLAQIRMFLMSLLIAGGFLIPGNIPNIIASSVIGIGFREWARYALPMGLPVFAATFFVLRATA